MSTSLANTFSSKYGALGFLAIFLANPVSAGPNDAVDDDGMILNARDAAAIAVNADKGVVGKQEPYIGSIGSELGQGEDLSEGNAEFTFRNGVLPADILAEEEEAVPAPILGRYRAKNPSPESVIGGNQGRQWLKTTVYPTRAVVYIYFNGGYSCTYSAPCDYIPRRSYPLFRAREVLDFLATPGAAELLAIPTPH